MNVSERVSALREQMGQEGIHAYIVPAADYHNSEYVGEYFKVRQFLTGFTGSAGTAVFTQDKAGLWTDGRYFLQAEEQLKGSGIQLYRMGEPETPTIEEFLMQELPEGGTIGFDGRTVVSTEGKKYEKIAREKGGQVQADLDLGGRIWQDRPPMSEEPAFLLSERWAGESTASKLKRLREKMKEAGAQVHLISSLDETAWLLNIRGNDISYCPLVLSWILVNEEQADLFADRRKFSDEMVEMLQNNRIILHPYEDILEAVGNIPEACSVLLDPDAVSYTLRKRIPEKCQVIEKKDPCILMKSMKNDREAENIRQAHLKDGIAHTRFMYWLKHNIGKVHITEISAAEKLEEFRREQEGYLGASFAPISAFGEHGAIVHYSATEESNASLKEGALFLTDTGGHYLEGTTDVTRTYALGEAGEREKEHFTLVARAMLRLADTVFLHGCTGANLDCIAREVLWKERINFNHGTGHGVGYLLSVHEGPVNFRWKQGDTPVQALEKNMVISDEPGIYISGAYGIRLENLLMVQEDEKNDYGQFMRFDILTWVPIDLDALLPEKMTAEERELLNAYHRQVYERISPYLPEEERLWLKEYTRPV